MPDAEIFKLCVVGDDTIEGRIALTDIPENHALYVDIVESAPHNIGKNKRHEGVGGHLFAIGVKRSMEKGYGGYMYMDAKNMRLVRHYAERLGAELIGRPHIYRMHIDTRVARILMNRYIVD